MQHATDCHVDPAAPQASREQLLGTDYVDLAIAGMGCANCANRIRNELLAQPGILEVEMDVTAGLARVWHVPTDIDVREIVAVVGAVGEGTHHRYLAVLVPPTPPQPT